MMDAAAELKGWRHIDIKLILVGDGNRKAALMSRARGEGLDNCPFFPPVRKTEIGRITADFDCGLIILANVPAFYQ